MHNVHGPHLLRGIARAVQAKASGKVLLCSFPSEFREGPPVRVKSINDDLFTEFANCLLKNGLENTLGLEMIQDQGGNMIEFSFDIGSLLLKEEDMRAEVREKK